MSSWMAPRAGFMLGMSGRSAQDARTSTEFATLASWDGTIVYEANPSGQKPHRSARPRLTRRAVFENPSHDRQADRLRAQGDTPM